MKDGARMAGGPAGGAGYIDDPEGGSFGTSQVRHFLHAPLRRPLVVLVPWLAVFLASVAALFLLPKKYMSSALVLVESERVPESFIPKVATRDMGQRLAAVRPEILSRTRLESVLQETQPYPELPKTRAVEKMRESIDIYLSGTDGFTLSFYHRDPMKAREVTDWLARHFIDETTKSRALQVEGAVDFLVTQVKDARTELENKDAALRHYKEQHMGKLPEQLGANLTTMEVSQREMQAIEESLLFAHEKQEALARNVGRGSSARGAAGSTPAATELDDLSRQLAALRARYKEAHPDVETLRARIARVEARLADARQTDGPGGDPADADPASALAREQLQRANLDIRKLEDRQRDLQARIAGIRGNIEQTPRTEQELATLTRDYKKLDENYTALLTKQLEAQMSGRLEQRWKGDRFRMLDPASLPDKPVFPKPPLFLAVGAILGLFVGIGASLVAEHLDPTVKDVEVLHSIQDFPLLGSIRHLPEVAAGARPGAPELDGAPQRGDVDRKDWISSLPGEAPFRPAGIVRPRKGVPILESLRYRNSVVGEELRFFASNVIDLCRRRDVRCLALTSALPDEGKSTLSLGLASALGREPGKGVLLIEGDLRRPSFGPTLGLSRSPGLSEWLNGTLDYVPVRAVEPGGFYLLTAGQSPLRHPELLGSARMDAVLKAGRRLFDFVIIDSVPVLPVADTVLMQDLVDGFLLVVRSRQTPCDAITDTVAKLRAERVLGVVFNGHREYKASHRYYGHQRYAMDYGAPPTSTPGAFTGLGLRMALALRLRRS